MCLELASPVEIFPLAPMGVLAPVSAHAGPSAQPPIGTSGNFPARISAESPSNISPNPSEVVSKVSGLSDKSLLEIFENSTFSGQNRVMEGSRFFPQIEIFQLLLLGSPCKNLEPYDKPFCDILEISPFSGQNRVKWGGRGGPRNLFSIGILIFLLLRSPCKFWKSYDNSFLEIEQTARRREK